MYELSVIVPVFNEAQNIATLHEEITRTLTLMKITYEVIFINDGSKDNSSFILDELKTRHEFVRVIHLQINSGQSFAMKQGIDAATGKYVAFLDADLQNNPTDISAMYHLLSACDVVLGYRGKRRDNLWKRATSEIGNLVIRLLFGVSVIDSGCTLRIGKAEVFKQLPYFHNFHRYFNLMIQKKKWLIVDFETNHRKRFAGESKYSVLKPFEICIELIQLKLHENKFKD